MSTLRSRLDAIALQFATAVLTELRHARLEDLLTEGTPRTPRARVTVPAPSPSTTTAPAPALRARRAKGRLRRRTPAELEAAVASVISTLQKGPLRAEQIQKVLGMDRRELPKVLAMAVASKKVSKAGRKRATVYSSKG